MSGEDNAEQEAPDLDFTELLDLVRIAVDAMREMVMLAHSDEKMGAVSAEQRREFVEALRDEAGAYASLVDALARAAHQQERGD